MSQPQQTQPVEETQSSGGLLSYFQLPETYEFVSLHSAAGYIELLKFVHDDVVTIPNKKRKIVAEVQIVNEGEYYILTLNWQRNSQYFATASAFIFDRDEQDGCEIRGYAELTNAIPLFGVMLFVLAVIGFFITGSPLVFLAWLILQGLATRGALRWRDALIQHLFNLAQMIPENRSDLYIEEEFDERVDLLVNGIKQGK